MTIEAILSSIDAKLATLIQLAQTPAVPEPIQPVQMTPTENIDVGTVAVAAAGLTGAQQAPLDPPKRGRGRPPKAETPPPVVSSPVDFMSLDAPAAEAEKVVTLQEVRAALAVATARDGQGAALELFKRASGAETLAKLSPDKYGAVFKAAIPTGKLELTDVRLVLVKANERKANSGLEVINKAGAKTLAELAPARFVDVILAAHQIQ